jgi:hypothetical protein
MVAKKLYNFLLYNWVWQLKYYISNNTLQLTNKEYILAPLVALSLVLPVIGCQR